jgi:cytochrome c553
MISMMRQAMTRGVWLLLVVGLAPLALAAPAQSAAPSAEAGAAKAVTCTACHGPAGNSANPLWPNLASQNAAYIVGQLKQFKANTRINSQGVMMGMAQTLDDQGMLDVATYFSTQTLTGGEADPSYWQAGQKLYRGGDPARGIPACMACHGPSGHGNPAAGYPALRAQHSQYVVKELTDYAGGKRYSTNDKGDTAGGPNSAIMATIAQRLSPEDMRNLASYVQGLR